MRRRLRELAAVRVRYGYRRLHVLLRREGWPINHKRVYRLYREEGLMIRTKHRKKRVSLPRVTPAPATRPNERWSMDFLSDTLVHGRSFKVCTLVDNVSRVSPGIKADFSIKGGDVVAFLDQLKARTGLPERLAVDNGPEFISKALDAWAYQNKVTPGVFASWQANRQRLRRIVQWPFPRGMSESALVREPRRGTGGDRSLASGVQRRPASSGSAAANAAAFLASLEPLEKAAD